MSDASGNETLGMPSPDALGDALAKLKENPEILSSIASALGMNAPENSSQAVSALSEMLDGVGGKSANSDENTNNNVDGGKAEVSAKPQKSVGIPPELIGKLPLILSMLSPKDGKSDSVPTINQKPDDARRTALLKALKPYMNPHRRDAIDKIIGITELGSLLKPR